MLIYVLSKQNILVQYLAQYWGMCEPAFIYCTLTRLYNYQVFLQTVHDKLSRFSFKLRQSFSDRLEQRLFSISANVVNIISLNRVQSNSTQVTQKRVFGLDFQANQMKNEGNKQK